MSNGNISKENYSYENPPNRTRQDFGEQRGIGGFEGVG